MSWWDIDDGNVSGDAPADSMRAALGSVAEARQREGRPLPTLHELLGAFARALQAFEASSAGDDAPPAPFDKLSARLIGQPDPVSITPDTDADPQLLEAFARAFAEIREQYRERWQRAPRRPELLEALSFILGYRPDRFLSATQDLNILHLSIE